MGSEPLHPANSIAKSLKSIARSLEKIADQKDSFHLPTGRTTIPIGKVYEDDE